MTASIPVFKKSMCKQGYTIASVYPEEVRNNDFKHQFVRLTKKKRGKVHFESNHSGLTCMTLTSEDLPAL